MVDHIFTSLTSRHKTCAFVSLVTISANNNEHNSTVMELKDFGHMMQ